MKRRLGLRVRATLAGTAVFAALLALGSILLVSTLETRLTQATDQLMRSRVEDLVALAARGDLPSTLTNVDDNGVAQVVTADGHVLASSPNILGATAIAHLRAEDGLQTRTFRAPDDRETETYRFWYASGPTPDGDVTVYVGNSLEDVSEASGALRRSLWIGIPGVVALLAVVIWVLLGRTIGRLDRIRIEVDNISQENLDTRVAGDGVDDEVGRLAATMNAMLERLDAAARGQRDFLADVSHDLQSPLAAQRIALELALAHPADVDVETLRDDVLGATSDMERLVGDLLVMASLDANTTSSPTLLDLDTLVLEEATRARAGGALVDTSAVSAAAAYANVTETRRVVRNLLDNAIAHAHGRVELKVDVVEAAGSARTWAQLLVIDDGPGVPPEIQDRIFDRFYRAESARSRGGSGLGLPIARGLAERNGGRVELLPSHQGTVMRLRLRTQHSGRW